MPTTALSRAQVLGYRAAVQHLERPAGDPMSEGVLLAGVQDYPPGRTAAPALRVRGAKVDPAQLVVVHSLRAAPHLHRASDIGCLVAALGTIDVADLAPELFGPFGKELTGHDLTLSWAMGHVAEAMRQVFADGQPRTKTDLSTAVTPLVDARLAPWCPRCGANHVQDALFRYATLQAGLVIAESLYVPFQEPVPPADPVESQTTLVRRFLRLCGPCQPEHLARWLAFSVAAARRLWPDQLAAVDVDGRPGWVHPDDLDELRTASAPTEVRLLPPYDPITELADRDLLVPDRAHRSAVWRPVGNPGVLLVRGEIAGTCRQRSTARRLTVTIQPFGAVSAADRAAATQAAEMLAEPGGPTVAATFA